jgi:hypothetical protein
MNGRVYDPVLGRFTSADPVGEAPLDGQSLNRYSYVFNNPLRYTDPSGFECYYGTFSWVDHYDDGQSIGNTQPYEQCYDDGNFPGFSDNWDFGGDGWTSGWSTGGGGGVLSGAWDTLRGMGEGWLAQSYLAGRPEINNESSAMMAAFAPELWKQRVARWDEMNDRFIEQGCEYCKPGYEPSAAQAAGMVGAGVLMVVTSKKSGGGKQYRYRGVHVGHPAFEDAKAGRAVPGNVHGTVTVDQHNAGGYSAVSPFTSWTPDINVARRFAGENGVVLRVPAGKPPPGATWSWEWSPDNYHESELLLRGVREGCTVLCGR